MQRTVPKTMIPLVTLVLVVGLLSTACSRGILRFKDSGRSMTRAEVIEVARTADLGRVGGADAADAPDLRTAALTELRSHGQDAQSLADALTASLPADYTGVPVYVEAARVDGEDCWIVVEAKPAASDASKLTGRRYWLLDRRTNQVVESATLN